MTSRATYVGVIGAGQCSEDMEALAEEVGREIAAARVVLICGGLGGVMTAAARGAKKGGGTTIGILPGAGIDSANEYIDFPIASNMGQARNAIIAHTSSVLISIGGGYGTLSEIAMALKIGKSVVSLVPSFDIPGIHTAKSPALAVSLALTLIS